MKSGVDAKPLSTEFGLLSRCSLANIEILPCFFQSHLLFSIGNLDNRLLKLKGLINSPNLTNKTFTSSVSIIIFRPWFSKHNSPFSFISNCRWFEVYLSKNDMYLKKVQMGSFEINIIISIHISSLKMFCQDLKIDRKIS